MAEPSYPPRHLRKIHLAGDASELDSAVPEAVGGLATAELSP